MRTAPSFYYSKRLLGGLPMREAFITKANGCGVQQKRQTF